MKKYQGSTMLLPVVLLLAFLLMGGIFIFFFRVWSTDLKEQGARLAIENVILLAEKNGRIIFAGQDSRTGKQMQITLNLQKETQEATK